jgi:predicted nuclease with TOPRIM domain
VQGQLQMVTQKLKESLFREQTEVLKLRNDLQMKLIDASTKIMVADRTAKRDESIAELDSRMESIKQRLIELENSVDIYPEPSSGTMYNSFWKVSEKNIMRETLGTGWDHKRTNITDMTKDSTVPSLMGRELRDAIKKRFKK